MQPFYILHFQNVLILKFLLLTLKLMAVETNYILPLNLSSIFDICFSVAVRSWHTESYYVCLFYFEWWSHYLFGLVYFIFIPFLSTKSKIKITFFFLFHLCVNYLSFFFYSYICVLYLVLDRSVIFSTIYHELIAIQS